MFKYQVKAEQKVRKLKKKRCKQCKEFFDPMHPLQFLCGVPCAIDYAKEQEKKKADRDWKKRKVEGLLSLKTLGEYEKEARVFFQRWIRLRDEKEPCISCGRFASRYDGGHYFKAELFSGLIFHEDNCHKQCSRPCNKDLHGNEANYRIGLVKKIGEERVKWLEENKDRLRTYSYTKQELLDIRAKYIKKIKEHKQK